MKSEYISLTGTATRNLVKYADSTGDEAAMTELGCRYLAGFKVRRNLGKAVRWLNTAASYGSGFACYMLAQLAEMQVGPFKGDDWAFNWHSQGAELGYSECFNQLGIMAAEGITFEADPELAEEYFRRAAEDGNENATENLKTLLEGLDRPYLGENIYD